MKYGKVRDLLDYDEASEYTGYTKAYLQRLVSERRIPFSKARNRVCFKKSKLDSWLDHRIKNFEIIHKTHNDGNTEVGE
jgi:excisionase family DNA binding protein